MAGKHNPRIGIMGGTFDPIHYGHLYIAECSRHRFGLDKVLFVPTGLPVHKKRTGVTNACLRLEMTRLAIATNPHFQLSTIEAERAGPSYAVDTLEQLSHQSVDPQDFYYITGADAILEILTWKNWARVFELCHFIAVTRPGYPLDNIDRVIADLESRQKERIEIYETSGILVSSTDIRDRVRLGETIKYLVPESVEDFILANGLYEKE